MTDYYRSTGSTGAMLIRDTGTNVEFWITSNNSTTFDHEMPWTSTINGYTYPGYYEHNYNANSGWNLVVSYSITVSQTVMFKLGPTGTSGLGGPTVFNQFIFRATVPAAPSTPTFASILPTSVQVNWSPNSDGGSAITGYSLLYGTDPTGVTVTTISATPGQVVTELTPGTAYYFWVKAINAVGTGPSSARGDVTTIAGARVRVDGVWVYAIPYVRHEGVWKLALPYVRSGGVWKETI